MAPVVEPRFTRFTTGHMFLTIRFAHRKTWEFLVIGVQNQNRAIGAATWL
jgi:hypothetical protein